MSDPRMANARPVVEHRTGCQTPTVDRSPTWPSVPSPDAASPSRDAAGAVRTTSSGCRTETTCSVYVPSRGAAQHTMRAAGAGGATGGGAGTGTLCELTRSVRRWSVPTRPTARSMSGCGFNGALRRGTTASTAGAMPSIGRTEAGPPMNSSIPRWVVPTPLILTTTSPVASHATGGTTPPDSREA